MMEQKVKIIAECGNNHEGNPSVAFELLAQAAKAGADAVKFQAGVARGFARNMGDVPRYNKYELGDTVYADLLKAGNRLGVPVFFSVWSDGEPETEKWLGKYRSKPMYLKIAARQSLRPEYVEQYDSITTFVSVGHDVERKDFPKLPNGSTPMHVVTEYPAASPMLERIHVLRAFYERPVGYSDHTIGIGACIDAVKLYEACVIEKHFTLAHNFGELRDHKLSATPDELKTLVETVRNIESCRNQNT